MDKTHFDTVAPRIRPIPPEYRWYRLLDPVSYDVGEPLSGDRITVEAGFETDFASIPKMFWSILPPFGRYSPAAIIHDQLYRFQERSRKESDRIFLEAMVVLKVKFWKRQAMYRALRAWGWIAWRKRGKQLAASQA